MERRRLQGRRLVAFLGSCGLNLLLLALIPFFFQVRQLPKKLPSLRPVPVWLPRQSPKPPPAAKKNLPEAPVEKLRLKPLRLEPLPAAAPRLTPKIDLPAIDVELAPRELVATVPVPALAAAPRDLFPVGEVDQAPAPLGNPAPRYPLAARRRGISGQVRVRFVVDREGRVGQVKILAADPPGFFEKSVRATLSRWHFRPGMVQGRAVNTLMETTIVFRLEK